MSDLDQTIETGAPRSGGLWKDAGRRLGRRRLAMACLGVVMLYFLVAGFVGLAEVFDWRVGPTQWGEEVGRSYSPPSLKNIFGTDIFGQSVLRKTLYGARVSITVAFCASLLSIAIGVPLGAVAGYCRGYVDDVIVWVYSTVSSVPYILLILAFAVVLRDKTLFGHRLTGITAAYLAIGLTSWVGICRLIRGEVIKHKDREYILAAVSYGCSRRRIIFRHLMPNVLHLVIVDFSLRFVAFVHAEVILSFLGLGESDRPSWGAMINDARMELSRGVWWQMAAATGAVFVFSLALNIFGDALRDSLDPKLGRKKWKVS